MNDKSVLGLNEIIGLIIHYFKYLKGVLSKNIYGHFFNKIKWGKQISGSLANFAKFWGKNSHFLISQN